MLNRKIIFKIFTTSIALLCLSHVASSQQKRELETDLKLIDLMVHNGTDVNKIHYVSYIIDCETEALLKDIILKSNELDYEQGYISFSESTNLWSTSFAKEMKLNIEEISNHKAPLTALLPKVGCKTISWGSTVEM